MSGATIIGNDAEAAAWVRSRWPDIEAGLARLRGDQVLFVTEEGVGVEDRRKTYRFLRRECPDTTVAKLRKPAPPGAFLLVLLRHNEIGCAVARPLAAGGVA